MAPHAETTANKGTIPERISTLSQPHHLFIDGKYIPGSDNATFPVRNPMTGDVLYECASASKADYETAIENAHSAYQTWSQTGPSARRRIFLKAADIMESYITGNAPEFMSQEVSATMHWVKVNVFATAGLFRETASLATHIRGEIVPADRPGTTILVERQAVGVVFAISPWNAPINLTARAIAVPLLCGNTVVLKPSEFSPKSQDLAIRALTAAGLPPGCVNVLPTSAERTPEVTECAVKHPKVLRVNFTGSDRVGRIIAGWAATCLKQCVLELGGKAPVVVFEDANVDDAVEAVVFGALAFSGQVCMSTERVILHKSISKEFKEKLLKKVETIKTGNHLEDSTVSISGLFTSAHATRVVSLLRSAVDGGATLLAGDLQVTGPKGTIIRPHILEGVSSVMDIAHVETFGPVILLSEFETDEEAVASANDSDFSLCGSVFSRDTLRALDISKRLRLGACHINGPSLYVESTLPQGGTGGGSGYGRFGGMAGVEAFTEKKIITMARPGLKFAL
ncbi:aldehyde dehydrogenase domain-containing protein [Triangularia verruculosa]|uniref:Aldehyde dehydrogenase domain-containing protein n=1 Tax=Triangularia verruculosa TaxID=2587418 RepID=A0AAN6XH27_9PEZI|nr:aldehyde dehydrogenase domain-containing protein [Triangularia verruculosa]